jgi:zinc D-Ala-D-Ala carboxypeptidase
LKHILILLAVALLLTACTENEVTGEERGPASAELTDGGEEAGPVHPRFSLSLDDLAELAENLPEEIRRTIVENPRQFLEGAEDILSLPREQVVLVDKRHPLLSDYAPEDLTDLAEYGFYLNKEGLQLREICIPDLLNMHRDASEEGLRLVISSAYRSYAYQKQVFQYHVASIGEEQARRESAEPGKSQHQLGTAVDFGSITPAFGDTPEGKWLRDNAWKYGFSLSYPEDLEELTGYIHEIWHYRWIGREAAAFEKTYFLGIQQYMLEFFTENREALEASRLSRGG